jgi:hypothetical protein
MASISFDAVLRDLVAQELSAHLAPLSAQLQQQAVIINKLAGAFGSGSMMATVAAPMKQRNKPGPKPKGMKAAKAVKVRTAAGGERLCAIVGCPNPARSKGYCANHYQKYNKLKKQGRLPSDWVEDAEPQSVENFDLPRGRAGAKLLAASRKGKRG